MDIREKVAIQIYEFVHRGKVHLSWDELPTRIGKHSYRELADQILALIEEAGYVQLAEDQSLPENPYMDGTSTELGWQQGIEDMLTIQNGTVWRKVVEVKPCGSGSR